VAEALGCAGLAPRGFDLAVARRRRRDERAEQPLGRGRDSVNRLLERSFVRPGRFLHPAHLAHVLNRRGADLVLARRRLEVVEDPDVPAHAPILRLIDSGSHGRRVPLNRGQ